MISALKRLVTTNDSNNNTQTNNNSNAKTDGSSSANNTSTMKTSESTQAISSPFTNSTNLLNNGMHMISQSLQKKFSRGVNYNMKIVIRGDCNVGKTCLWLRLQGQAFKELYETSEEIRVANINWNYKTTDDVVKVEVWDVVDRSKKKRALIQQNKSLTGLKLDNSVNESAKVPVEASLDAEFIDVYKNANGCILVYDITKQWTWDYIERELPKIPSHIPVLIIGNHRDMHHHRVIDELKCKFYCENLKRGSLGSEIRYTETSMRTGFGLKYIYKFFNIPFLQLQRENLMQQLETNAKEMDAICEELKMIEENMEGEYDQFSQNLNSKRRQQQEENAKDILKNAKSVDEARKIAAEKEAIAKAQAEAQATEPQKVINQLMNKLNTKIPIQQLTSAKQNVSMSVTIDPNAINKPSISPNPSGFQLNLNNLTLDEHHDDELNRFLEDPVKNSNLNANSQINVKQENDDEDDQVNNNPMVAAFKETLDSEDEAQFKSLNTKKTNNLVKNIDISDSDEDDKKKYEDSPKKQDFLSTKSNNQQQNDFVLLNKSISSHDENKNKLDTFSTTSSILNIDVLPTQTTNINNSSLPLSFNSNNISESHNNEPASSIKLTNDDFEFLERMTSNDDSASNTKTKSKKASSKSSTGKKSSTSKSASSSKIAEDLESNSSEAASTTKTKKKKKTSKEKDNEDDNDHLTVSKSSKSKKSKSKKVVNDYNNEEDDDDNDNRVYVKKDVDYDEI